MTIHLSNKDETVKAIVKAAFPEYTGNKIKCIPSESVSITGTNWSGGYKNDYVIVRLSDITALAVPDSHFMDNSDRTYNIPSGFVVVCLQYAGQNKYVTIFAASDTITPMLTQEIVLTRNEKVVLAATRSYKSSYGGISNYRFNEAKQITGISLAEWNETKESLISKGFLNRTGAITIEGKNAIGSTDLWNLKVKDLYNFTERE